MTTPLEDLLETPQERRPSRRRKIVIIVALIVLLPAAALLGLITQRAYVYDGNITRVPDVFPTESDRPLAEAVGDAQNWLVIGSDRRPDQTGFQRADSIMIAHIPADRKQIFLISIPRDAYVSIPGRGKDKINSAYAYGGPKLLIRTIEKLTRVRIDHFAAIGFSGFADLSTALGGVDLYVAGDSYDTANKIAWKKGKVHLEGERALLFVRQRYGLPGGDFDRIKRQQAFLRAVADKAISGRLTNPFVLDDFLQAMTKSIAVDSAVKLSTLRDLVLELRAVRSKDVLAVTMPISGTATVDHASIVRLDAAAGARLADAIRSDILDRHFHETGGGNDLSSIR
jgi:LCP family protein required for cell wall assembly